MRREDSSIGQFRLERLLGHGGMGTVYTAIDEMTGRQVAVKLLRPELLDQTDFVDRFKAEARTLARLDHPRVARLFGFFQHGDDLLMVMEYVRGATLASLIRERGAVAPDRAVAWAGDMFEALHYAHEQGVVHRDVKPANIIIDEQQRARLTDFGIAKSLGDGRLTQTGHAVGTIAYMAPEQVLGVQIDGRADLYAGAVVLYEMLTGAIPYTATTTFTLMREVSEGVPVTALDALPPEARPLRSVLTKALSASPDDRYPDGRALRDALFGALNAEGVPLADSVPPSLPARVDSRRHTTVVADIPPVPQSSTRPSPVSVLWAGSALGVISLIVAGILWARQPAPDPLPPAAAAAAAPAPGRSGEVALSAEATGTPDGTAATAPPAHTPVVPADPGPTAPQPKREAGPTTDATDSTPEPERRPASLAPLAEDEGPAAGVNAPRASSGVSAAEFTRALMMVPIEDDTDEIEVVLRFDRSRLVVANADTRVPVKTIAYGTLAGASYSEVKSRMRLFRGPSHWLDLNLGREHVVLRLDKRNFADIIAMLEARAGLTVQRVERR